MSIVIRDVWQAVNRCRRGPTPFHSTPRATFFLHLTQLTHASGHCGSEAKMKQVIVVGVTVLAGAALIEAALIPGLLIGGAAVLAPRLLPELPNPIRRRKPQAARQRAAPVASASEQESVKASTSLLPKFAMGQAVAKT